MFANIESGKRVYLKELRKYVDEVEEARQEYKRLFGGNFNNLEKFPFFTMGALRYWDDKLRSMERVLGLTKKEIAKIGKELGVKRLPKRLLK